LAPAKRRPAQRGEELFQVHSFKDGSVLPHRTIEQRLAIMLPLGDWISTRQPQPA
jgi:hypothetical protein